MTGVGVCFFKGAKPMTPMITVYDTTLRDGAQRAGLSFSVTDKLRIARRLDDLGIPYYIFDFSAEFKKKVIDYFCDAHISPPWSI